jgi:hypothetical protein
VDSESPGSRLSRRAASARRPPPACRGRAGYRGPAPFRPAVVRDEPATQGASMSHALRAGPRSRLRAGKRGRYGGALRLPRRRLPRPPQALRTWPACERALRVAASSHRASPGDLPPRPSPRSRPCRTWRRTCRGRPEARLELPASASERRSARPGSGACGVRRRWVAPECVRTGVAARSGRRSTRSAGASEADRWSRDRSGPVVAARPLAGPVSCVPRCSSLNDYKLRQRLPGGPSSKPVRHGGASL